MAELDNILLQGNEPEYEISISRRDDGRFVAVLYRNSSEVCAAIDASVRGALYELEQEFANS